MDWLGNALIFVINGAIGLVVGFFVLWVVLSPIGVLFGSEGAEEVVLFGCLTWIVAAIWAGFHFGVLAW